MKDFAQKWTDEQIDAITKRFNDAYAQAAREMGEKLARSLADYARENEQRQKALDNTPEARAEYEKWKQAQALDHRWLSDMSRQLAEDATRANMHAADMINDFLPRVYAENANMSAFELDNHLGYDTGFTLVNEDAVRTLMGMPSRRPGDDQLLREVTRMPEEARRHVQDLRKREVDYPRDMHWNRERFHSAITQGILQGESIPNIVKRMSDIYGRNRNSAIRAARTATTNAENAGRMSTFERAQSLGIDMEIEWLAALDGRTRSAHRELDGQRIRLGEKFVNSIGAIRWPGDPQADAANIWNCRCRANGRVVGFDGKRGDWVDERGERWTRLPKGMTYDEWKNAKAISREQSYKNPAKVREGFWTSDTDSGKQDIAELERIAAKYRDEVNALARDAYRSEPSSTLIEHMQELTDKYAAQMAEYEWAKDFDVSKLEAEVDKLYEKQEKVWNRIEELRKRRKSLRGKYDDESVDEYLRLGHESDRLHDEYDSYFEKVDNVYEKIDAHQSYNRAKSNFEQYSERLEKETQERNEKVAKIDEAKRLLPEARRRRNQAYQNLSDAQPFAPHVREVIGDDYADKMMLMVSEAEQRHPEIAGLYRRFSSQLRVAEKDVQGTAFYQHMDLAIHFNATKASEGNAYKAPYQTAFHEFGHLIDDVGGFGEKYTSQEGDLLKTIKSDWARFRNQTGRELGVTRNKNDATISMLKDEMAQGEQRPYTNVSDIIEGCTRTSHPLGVGHGAAYHTREGATVREFFAEVCDSAITNEAAYQQMRRIFPNAVDMVENMAREMLE